MSESRFLETTADARDSRVFAVVVVAAGMGTRLGEPLPKAAVEIAGKTLLQWALEGVIASKVASRIVVPVPPEDTILREICTKFGAYAVDGGVTRADSVHTALAAIPNAAPLPGASDAEPDAVLVHDSARCFTPVSSFENVCEALTSGEKAVIPVLPVVDTIKSIDADGYVTGTPARSGLRAVQTPQGFDLATLLQANRDLKKMDPVTAETITDDAMLAETLGIPVKTVPGHADAFKVTTPLDLILARALYEKED